MTQAAKLAALGTSTGTSVLVSGTAVASTSGTSIDFTSIPSWAKRITVMFNNVSTNGTSSMQLQLGTSGGVQTTSYSSGAWTANTNNTTSTTGMVLLGAELATYVMSGQVVLTLFDSATGLWVSSSNLNGGAINGLGSVGGGTKTLSGTLDRIRITTVNGTDTFDAGSINILYE